MTSSLHVFDILSKVGKYHGIFEKVENIHFLSIFSIYVLSICTYIAKIIYNLLSDNSMCVCALHIR